MALPIAAVEPSKLVNSLDFEGKGLTHPVFVSHFRHEGKEARLVVKALFRGPRPGWPILDKKKILDTALKTADKDWNATTSVLGDGIGTDSSVKNNVPICVAEIDPVYPIPVVIRIALTSQPGACDDMLKVARAYSQLYANDYLPFELPVAMWRTVEGIWSVAMDEAAVPLSAWWEQNVQPQIQASESRWKIGSWRRKSEDHDTEAAAPILAELEGRHREEQQEQKKRIHFLDEASHEIRDLLEKKESPVSSQADSPAEKAPSQQDKVAHSISKKTEKMIADGIPSEARTPNSDDDEEISISRKQEWAARIQQQNQDIRKPKAPSVAASGDVTPITKQIGVDEDEEEAMVIDRGWLQAVNILIQLADIILVSRSAGRDQAQAYYLGNRRC